mmetsp:Transcript_33615/g.81280  ORF Transcript_33615/g.81280 Transcript_33615/m.81280 type:complete len:204 (-) Transcript_33615:2301-2912(-)
MSKHQHVQEKDKKVNDAHVRHNRNHHYLTRHKPRSGNYEDRHKLRQGNINLFNVVGESVQNPAKWSDIEIRHRCMENTMCHCRKYPFARSYATKYCPLALRHRKLNIIVTRPAYTKRYGSCAEVPSYWFGKEYFPNTSILCPADEVHVASHQSIATYDPLSTAIKIIWTDMNNRPPAYLNHNNQIPSDETPCSRCSTVVISPL